MFGLGVGELALIGGIVLLFFGPKKLPELAKGIGIGIRDFKKALASDEEPADDLIAKKSTDKV